MPSNPTVFRLGDEHERLIARLSEETGLSKAEIVRQALDLFAAQRTVTATYAWEVVHAAVACRDCDQFIKEGWREIFGDRRGALVCASCLE